MALSFKIIFMMSLMLGSLISISSLSWLMAWMGLEINLLSFIPLMKTKSKFSHEAMIKYFIIQAMASMIFLMSSLLSKTSISFPTMIENYSFLISLSLLMKMGAAPFHFWLPEVASGLSWMNLFILLTWQKIAPMMLLSLTTLMPSSLSIFIIFSSLIGSIQGINQTCMRKIMTYSSINHIGWMLSAILNSITLWFLYFMIYMLTSMNIIIILMKNNIIFLNQMSKMISFNKNLKLFFMSNFMSLGGLPPLIGFFPKWILINIMIKNNQFTLVFLLILLTIITLYFYIRICISSFTFLNKESLLKNSFNLNFWYLFINFIILSSLLIMVSPSEFL
uniref:NADH-ubiquinone oxidoreductase chain 2 n=1 Tax=Curculionoidea sp. 19 KM-2017 TaxID=2219402 RepID=A0A346RIN4_9CUCU|nr:NADH dehydrogenase subunit 2 [Curculionoidea sp. 19 KM-2017]